MSKKKNKWGSEWNVTKKDQEQALEEYQEILSKYESMKKGIPLKEPVVFGASKSEDELEDDILPIEVINKIKENNLKNALQKNKEDSSNVNRVPIIRTSLKSKEVKEEINKVTVPVNINNKNDYSEDLETLEDISEELSQETTESFKIDQCFSDFVIVKSTLFSKVVSMLALDSEEIENISNYVEDQESKFFQENLDMIQFIIASTALPSAILTKSEFEKIHSFRLNPSEEVYVFRVSDEDEEDEDKVAIFIIDIDSFAEFEHFIRDYCKVPEDKNLDNLFFIHYAILFKRLFDDGTNNILLKNSYYNTLYEFYESGSLINETFRARIDISGEPYEIPKNHYIDPNTFSIYSIHAALINVYNTYVNGDLDDEDEDYEEVDDEEEFDSEEKPVIAIPKRSFITESEYDEPQVSGEVEEESNEESEEELEEDSEEDEDLASELSSGLDVIDDNEEDDSDEKKSFIVPVIHKKGV